MLNQCAFKTNMMSRGRWICFPLSFFRPWLNAFVTAEEARIPIGFEFVEGDHHDVAFITRILVFVYDTQTPGIEAKFCMFFVKMFRFTITFPKILREKRQNFHEMLLSSDILDSAKTPWEAKAKEEAFASYFFHLGISIWIFVRMLRESQSRWT